MNYLKDKNRIVVEGDFFNIRQTLESGQMFRFFEQNGTFKVYSLDKTALLYNNMSNIVIKTDEIDYFINYFDLDTDYQQITQTISQYNDFLSNAVQYGKGIRILRQNPFETIISFIISANNNIKRIKGIIDRICDICGESIGQEKNAFPSAEKLATLSANDFSHIGCGYRSAYLCSTVQDIFQGKFDIYAPFSMSTDNARKYLSSLCGVGPKVADCILLFAYRKTDSFPVDTWINKSASLLLGRHFEDTQIDNMSAKNKSHVLSKTFGSLSGFVQQYVFYYARQSNLFKSIDK